jgi:hypothetical protein
LLTAAPASGGGWILIAARAAALSEPGLAWPTSARPQAGGACACAGPACACGNIGSASGGMG